MRKIIIFRYALLLSILLISISSYRFVRGYIYANRNDSSFLQESLADDAKLVDINIPEYDTINTSIDSVKDSSNIYNPPLIDKDKAIEVFGVTIMIGESLESIINKLGRPNRIAKTEMDFDCYVYNNNYSRLLFLAIKDRQLAGYYTDSIDFNYLGITPGIGLEQVNKTLSTDYSMDYVLNHTTDSYTLRIFMDALGTQGVTGVSLIINDVSLVGYSDEIERDLELLIYDLTNSIRKRYGIPILTWSSSAARAAKKHSIDMAVNRFFDHYNLFNNSPGDRLKEEGIPYRSVGENIIAGYENALISFHAWFNSPDHRDNILNELFTGLGVGFTYQEDSIYKTYITQNFFR